MDRRTRQANPAKTLAAAIARAGETPISVSLATGIPLSNLADYLTGRSDLDIDGLGKVGGFLHVHPADLLEVAA